jgi:hypothetical protein
VVVRTDRGNNPLQKTYSADYAGVSASSKLTFDLDHSMKADHLWRRMRQYRAPRERIAGFVHIGKATRPLENRERPNLADFVTRYPA